MNQRVMIEGQTEAFDQLLAEYSAGTLPRPLHVLVASHLELSGRNRAFVRRLETTLARDFELSEMAAPVRDRSARLNAIFNSAPDAEAPRTIAGDILPSPLAAYLGKPMSDVRWKSKLFGIREAVIEKDGGVEASLLWVKAGKRMPSHTHDGAEVTLVLSGAFSDVHGHYRRGDVAVADPDVDHDPMIDASADCICFVVTDAPLRLTGPIGRIVSRIFQH